MLGDAYEYGRGISQNYTQARFWYTKAADQGHAKAYWDLKKLDKTLSADSLNRNNNTYVMSAF